MLRILFVAMAESVHTARWINQVTEEGWDIHLFPSTDGTISADLRNLTVHDGMIRYSGVDKSVRQLNAWPWPFPRLERWAGLQLKRLRRSPPLAPYTKDQSRAKRLTQVIRQLKPDVVHSIEMQHAGYLTLEARKQYVGPFPPWIITNWGSDIYFFGRLAEHMDKIKTLLATCDYYSCECQRDVHLAKQMGLKGEVLPVLPNTGGFDLARVAQFRQPGPTSTRRLVILKGYQSLFGRALVGLRAIALCANELKGYRIAIYLASPEVKIAAELASQSTGIPIDLIPLCSHDDMLRLYGRARIYIGLSISDAASTSLLEAMVMGTFPIQSCTACADEWIRDGVSGFIVPPEDPEPIAVAIRRALSDNKLVDQAAEINDRVARERIDQAVIRPQVIAMYEKVASRSEQKQKSGAS